MQAEDWVRIQHMIGAAQSVERFLVGRHRLDLDQDEMLRFALTRAVQILGEAASRVSPQGQLALPNLPWKEITGMRNRLVHAYFDVDSNVLWKTATEAIPQLLQKLASLGPAKT